MVWSLYENEKFLKPLIFSNGKSQEDIVKEVLKAIQEGEKIILIKGMCGTGKSAIALQIANELGKTSIVVPGKNLQEQYKKDYEKEKYLLKSNKEKLKISVITGRNNHVCKFLEDSQNAIPIFKKEINSNLHDIFEGKLEELKQDIQDDLSADNPNIPCKIEIKEKNFRKIKEYIKKNKNVDSSEISEIKDVRRIAVAGVCPYWFPLIPDTYELKNFKDAKKLEYTGLKGIRFTLYERHAGCKFYEQFKSFVESDVIVFNSLKYKLESILNRKPLTEAEIIDEGDEFLDNFANSKSINLNKLQSALFNFFDYDKKHEAILTEIREIVSHIKRDGMIEDAFQSEKIIPLKITGIYDLFKIFLKNPEFLNEVDEESYLLEFEEIARNFEGSLEDSYVTVEKKEEALILNVVTTDLAKRFKEMVDKNKVVILMSGTLHSEEVLRDVFGLKEFKTIEAETIQPGEIVIKRTGLEEDCKYSNFSCGKLSRGDYLRALEKCIELAQKPAIVQVNSFRDLPSEQEIAELGLEGFESREQIRQTQREDKKGKLVKNFKEGKKEILFSTRVSRGIDFPGEQCQSIIFTKYPNPNVQEPFWKILAKTNPSYYWEFYRDKAQRELLQKVYRGVRFKEDRVEIWSPDSRVLDKIEEHIKK